jgi:hypothetical protein
MNITTTYNYIPWEGGYSENWILFIAVLVLILILNVITLVVVIITNLNDLPSGYTYKYLAIINIMLSLFFLVQSSLNYHYKRIYGDDIGCNIQSIYIIFCLLSIGFTLCVIAYNSRRIVHIKNPLSKTDVFRFHFIFWILNLTVSFLAGHVIQAEKIVPSGSFCLVTLNYNRGTLIPGLILYISYIFLIGGFLIYTYAMIYFDLKRTGIYQISPIINNLNLSSHSIKNSFLTIDLHPPPQNHIRPSPSSRLESSSSRLESSSSRLQPPPIRLQSYPISPPLSQGILIQPPRRIRRQRPNSIEQSKKDRESKTLKRLLVFVITFFIGATPLMIVGLYEITTGKDANSFNSLINPILYVWLSPVVIKEIKRLFNKTDKNSKAFTFTSRQYTKSILPAV